MSFSGVSIFYSSSYRFKWSIFCLNSNRQLWTRLMIALRIWTGWCLHWERVEGWGRELLIAMEGYIPVTDLETLLSELGCKSQCLCFLGILGFLNVTRFILASVLRTMCWVYMSCSFRLCYSIGGLYRIISIQSCAKVQVTALATQKSCLVVENSTRSWTTSGVDFAFAWAATRGDLYWYIFPVGRGCSSSLKTLLKVE